MPELPEVETTRRGLARFVEGATITRVVSRTTRLRWPVAHELHDLAGCRVHRLTRRGKWLLWHFERGTLLWHLGMSGSFRVWSGPEPAGPHDHLDLQLAEGVVIRYTDPRRFGAVLWQPGENPELHPMLARLGPEPLGTGFDGDRLWHKSRGRRIAVKPFIMDAAIVVGVGNIYATESLYRAGIDPRRAAGRISRARYQRLAEHICDTLREAIEVGGTTLRDFSVTDGRPGYFAQRLEVYGRAGQPCRRCLTPLKQTSLGQRSTVWCPRCQH